MLLFFMISWSSLPWLPKEEIVAVVWMKRLQKSAVWGPRKSILWQQTCQAVEKVEDMAEHIGVKLGAIVKTGKTHLGNDADNVRGLIGKALNDLASMACSGLGELAAVNAAGACKQQCEKTACWCSAEVWDQVFRKRKFGAWCNRCSHASDWNCLSFHQFFVLAWGNNRLTINSKLLSYFYNC